MPAAVAGQPKNLGELLTAPSEIFDYEMGQTPPTETL